MGRIEEAGRKRKRKRDLTYAILAAVKASALIGIFMMAPNMPIALEKMGLIPKESNDTSTIGRARRRLMTRGFLSKTKEGYFKLTPKGTAAIALLEAQYSIKRPKTWDGRWRVLIFDVPEYRKTVRDKIRRTLMHIGFTRLQDSVWVYPYDCEDLIALLKADFRIGKDVLYMIVDEMEGDSRLRREFHLSKER